MGSSESMDTTNNREQRQNVYLGLGAAWDSRDPFFFFEVQVSN
jgi:hypothetical protein